LTLLLGAIGLPLPIGVAAVLAGSLAALGNLRWQWAGLIAVVALLQRWGGITVIVSRTLTSSLSSVVSIFAGVSRYRFLHFPGFALLGRLIWTSAYLGLGYGIGGNIDAASQFLGNLNGLVIALGVLVVSSAYRAEIKPS
jgi:membrane protein DedA with SNARE-associated domain